MLRRETVGRRTAVRAVGTLGIASAALLGAAGGASRAAAAPGQEIVGSWIIASPGPTMRLMQTYYADGSHLSIHDEHPLRSPQLGSWVRTGEREFLMRNVSFTFDQNGQRTGSIDVRATYTVSPTGDSMTGRGVRYEYDVDGALRFPPVPWTSEAVRLVPLPFE